MAVRADLDHGTIPAMVRNSAARWPEAEAVVDGAQRITFAELADRVTEAARAFVAAGIAKGDRVAIWAPNIWEWIVAAAGLQSAGGVLVPLNTRFKGQEAAYVLGRSRARILLTVQGFLDSDYVGMLDAAGRPETLEQIVVLRGDVPEGCLSWDGFLAGAASVDASEVDRRIAELGPEDVSDILFTSGTTGMPKGVVQTHGQTLRAYGSWSEVIGLRPGDRYLIVNPFFHAFGYKAGWMAALLNGATIVPHAVFDVPSVLARVPEERISVLPGPPTLYQSILAHPDRDRFDLSTLRLSVTGAAAIPVELIDRMRRDLTFETIITGYGLTEACGIATMCRFDDDPETIAKTSGRAIPDVEVAIVDDDGHEVPRGEPGEVVVRGYNVMREYYENPEATAETIDADGWLHTGDVGVMDERGYIRITDRTKDMFIVGGFNAYPAEIENLMLGTDDAIAQVAVIGIPDERLGEVGAAFVVPRAGSDIDPDGLVARCRESMANYKAPRRVKVVDELPLNATGKVQKFVLREWAEKEGWT